jgi:hypothetical protein
MKRSSVLSVQTAEALLRLCDLHGAYGCLRDRFERVGKLRPAPLALWSPHEMDQAHQTTYLSEADWLHFPVTLEGVRQSDQLMVYFKVYPFPDSDTHLLARMRVADVEQAACALREGAHNDVTEWNLLHLNFALYFAQLVPPRSRFGISEYGVEAIQRRSTEAFAAALKTLPVLKFDQGVTGSFFQNRHTAHRPV